MTADGFAVSTASLGKRFKNKWALAECSFDLPEGKICGLVGSNGASKTTLLRLITGLAQPSSGAVQVFGQAPADTREFLHDVGFLAQDVPLYKRWNSEDHLALGAHMNPRWDDSLTRERIRSLGIPLDQRVGTLSGGQRARSRWRWPLASGRGCCCSTNRSPRWIRWPAGTSCGCSPKLSPKAT